MFKMRMRLIALVVLGLILSAAVYGFAAANTIGITQAGEGSEAISGYYVLNVTYTLDSTDPAEFSAVSFNLCDDASCTAEYLDADVGDIYVGVADSSGTIAYANSCAYGGGKWTCTYTSTPSVSVHDAERLHVSAAQ